MGTAIEASREAATATANGYFHDADQSFGECRRRLISYLVKLNHALNGDLPDLSKALLSRFCDCLVDYLSAGHFRVFQRCSLAAQYYAAIEATTDAGMAFNDRYGQQRTLPAAELRASCAGMYSTRR
jgi:regulator of sigma D